MSDRIKVMSAGAVEGPVTALAFAFTEATGCEVELSFNTVGANRDRFVAGEKTDVIILSTAAIEALDKESRFVTAMLKNAGSIACNDPAHGGSSGIYFIDLLKRMGLYDEVKPKLVLCKTGRDCAITVLRLQAEIGITFTSEFIAVPGTRVVGTFPKEIGYVNGYAGAVPKDAAIKPARAFLEFMTSASSKECFKSFGLE